MEKTMENHLVDPTEKSENAESSENVTDKRNQKYITPNNRLTIIVQQCAANTRLDEKLRLLLCTFGADPNSKNWTSAPFLYWERENDVRRLSQNT